MKQSDRKTPESSAAKIKSAVPPKKPSIPKETCEDPKAGTAARDESHAKGVIVAPTPDKQDSSRKQP